MYKNSYKIIIDLNNKFIFFILIMDLKKQIFNRSRNVKIKRFLLKNINVNNINFFKKMK